MQALLPTERERMMQEVMLLLVTGPHSLPLLPSTAVLLQCCLCPPCY